MKKTFLFFLLFLFTTISAATTEQPVKKIIFFGDSLSDNGRLYNILFNIVPKSPPYFKGRFTNGPTWAEDLGKFYYDKYYIGYKDYALGSSTAVFHFPTFHFVVTSTLEMQIYNYLVDSLLSDKVKNLFSIWIGSNDLLFYQHKDPEKLTSDIVDKIVWAVKLLISHGGKQFLLLNLPDASITPFGNYYGRPRILHDLTEMTNKKLAAAVKSLRHDYPDHKFVLMDMNGILSEFILEPDVFNKKYNMHITNTTHSCWEGGYFNDQFMVPPELRDELEKVIRQRKEEEAKHSTLNDRENFAGGLSTVRGGIDLGAMVSFFNNSPEIQYVYNVGKLFDQGLQPCSNPSDYLFWDGLHPTEGVHQVMAKIVEEQLAKDIFS